MLFFCNADPFLDRKGKKKIGTTVSGWNGNGAVHAPWQHALYLLLHPANNGSAVESKRFVQLT